MAFNSTPADIIEQNINGLLQIQRSWERVPLVLVSEVTNGYAFKSASFNNVGEGQRLLRIRDVLPGDTKTYYSGPVPNGYWVNPNDIIVGMDGDFNLAWWASGPALLNQRVCRLDVNSQSYIKRFFYWVLPGYIEAVNLNTSSTTVKHLSSKTLKELLIPLPPLAEQKVIADKLDTLLAQVETTKARLDRIPHILKHFRQSVLAAAVSGRLTEECSFTELKLSEIAEFQNGYAFKSGWFKSSGTQQVVKLGNIRDGYLELKNSPAYVSDKLAREFSRYTPNTGDTLISMTGTRFKKDYGFGCMIKDEKHLLVNQRVGRVIPNRSKVNPEFLTMFIRSDRFRDQFFGGETGGVNQGNVGSKHILSILIQVPSKDVQDEIVRQVNQLFGHADRIEQYVQAAQERVNNLTQSILAKAFRGELTKQWRKDNPELISGENSAAALLEKIKGERKALKPAKATRARKAT